MGIECERFIGDSYGVFVCTVCLDVVDDPVMTPCEHVFCKSCFPSTNTCPTCRKKVTETKPLGRILKQVYTSLKLSCLSEDCKVELTVANYKGHDVSCPKKFYDCPTCKCVLIIGKAGDHDCIEYFKNQVKSLQQYIKDGEESRVKCGLVFKNGAAYYFCKICAKNRSMALCERCFNQGDHDDHEYEVKTATGTGAYCDCGDDRFLKKGHVHCKLHKHPDGSVFSGDN